ncbi:Tetratricopeptide repeat-containing protein [Lentibacillus halodurans]|uniref:Tetratricopeptide repeat-containing protein n=1 Tax=Lentibacillus halodurans TaxID=237679 RepID=A0A1I0VCX9_9BACI|nr:tetratricopeptide repeat protein [Lentibacillus halodurans]SFA73903.1 Tetratricopeptide repeat-containing protein [Lentibacillus halodurans]
MDTTIMEAVHLMESKQSDKAISLLEDYLPKADDEEKFTIAELFIQWGFLAEAADILQELIHRFPNESEIKIMLADVYIEQDNDEEAINLLNEIGEEDPDYVQALMQLADLYQVQGLFEVAEQKLLAAKHYEPNEPIINFALGELLFSNGDYREAITYYEKILAVAKEIANVSINDRLAEAYAASGEYETALETYQDIDSEDPDTLFKYGFTAMHAGRRDIAIQAWKHVIEQDMYYHTAYYQLAKAYEDEDMMNEAYDTAKQGIQVDEFNKELYFFAGSMAHQLGKEDESEKWVREAVTLDPDYKEAVLFLIELFKQQDKQDHIIDLIADIQNMGASDPLYEWELARAYNEIESLNNALKHYQEAYNSLNQDSDFLKEYGYFLTEEGRVDSAIQIFEAYLRIQPLDADIEEYVERLKHSREI